jgi:hypothetical protein
MRVLMDKKFRDQQHNQGGIEKYEHPFDVFWLVEQVGFFVRRLCVHIDDLSSSWQSGGPAPHGSPAGAQHHL